MKCPNNQLVHKILHKFFYNFMSFCAVMKLLTHSDLCPGHQHQPSASIPRLVMIPLLCSVRVSSRSLDNWHAAEVVYNTLSTVVVVFYDNGFV